MAVKTTTEVSQNGHVTPDPPVTPEVKPEAKPEAKPEIRKVVGFQLKYMKRLIDNFERAQLGVQQAQDAANEFIAALAEEESIELGRDGWTFDIDSFEFVRVPQQDGAGKQEA